MGSPEPPGVEAEAAAQLEDPGRLVDVAADAEPRIGRLDPLRQEPAPGAAAAHCPAL